MEVTNCACNFNSSHPSVWELIEISVSGLLIDVSQANFNTQLINISCSVKAWILLRNFNVVRDVSERINNTPPTLADIVDFNSCLLKCGVDDITATGCEMTWTNKQDIETLVWSKLDRALANTEWLNIFPGASANFLPLGISVDSLVLVSVLDDSYDGSRFSFLNSWVEHPTYHSIVQEAWLESVNGSQIYNFFAKMKNVKTRFIKLHKGRFTQISQRDEDLPILLKHIDSTKIKNAVFSIGSDKSPGPDGFSSEFFKSSSLGHCWD
ncbi:uncharacterized protein LOC141614276 [Silene latifolia]|uniref:uncharacterized protein LOC141614276 n=1 Tax=Silene latifolia TaxID=37657 RepID=UPI003D76EAAD